MKNEKIIINWNLFDELANTLEKKKEKNISEILFVDFVVVY